jgi:hypothetical protein
MDDEDNDTIFSQLITDFTTKISKQNIKHLTTPLLSFAEEYLKAYIYFIYSLILIILLISIVNLLISIRVYSKIVN